MSHTNAKRLLFSYSDKDIIDDFKKQRMERAVAQELQDSPLIIRQTGIFKDIDAKYGTGEVPPAGEDSLEGGEGEDEMNLPPIGGGDMDTPQSPNDLPPVIGQGQGFKDDRPVIAEKSDGTLYIQKPKMTDIAFNDIVENLVDKKNSHKVRVEAESKELIKETNKKNTELNTRAVDMVKNIDSLMENSKFINTTKSLDSENFTRKIVINEDVDIMNLDIPDEDKNDKEDKGDK